MPDALDEMAGEDGFALACGARGLIGGEVWRFLVTLDSWDDPQGQDYQVAGFYEHFAHEGRVAILRALLRHPEEGLTPPDLAAVAGMRCPEECVAHLQALMASGLVERHGERVRVVPAATAWVAVPLALVAARLRMGLPGGEE
jgi:hypothetical protein